MRLLIQIQERSDEPGRLPEPVREVLAAAGAKNIRPSHPELPGLYTAEAPDDADLSALLKQLRELPQVRHAEPDTFRTTL